MKLDVAQAGRGVAIAGAAVAWALAAHYTSAMVESSYWGAVLGMAPFAAIAGTFAWRSTRPMLMLSLLALASTALVFAWPLLAQNVGWLYFVQHVATNALLGIGFGRTLVGGREPMCTQVATVIHREVSPALAAYTRKVTVAWTVYFTITAILSALLFAFAPMSAWSIFANLLTLPLITLMFIAEYGVRMWALPDDRSSILDAIRAYRQSGAAISAPPAPTRCDR